MKINRNFDSWIAELLNNKYSSIDDLSLEDITDEIEEVRQTYANERLWSMGAATIDEADMHINNMEELSGYLDFLYDLKTNRIDNQINPVIDSPEEAAKQFDDIKNKKVETVCLITLDGARRLINKHTISIGTLTSSLVHPREVFYPAIEDRAASIIIAHNHPSGMLIVSEKDIEVTKRIKETGDLVGIPLDDHIIVTSNGFVSAA